MFHTNFRRSWAVALMTACLLSACEGDIPTSTQTPESVVFAPILGVSLDSMTRTSTGLYFRDLSVGDSTEAVAGKSLGVQYAGFLSNGTSIDAVSSGIFTFRLGAGEVIAGWDQGLAGMRVGGRRQLVIPPDLGYGSNPHGPIPGGSVLIFIVDLLSVSN